MNNLKKMENVQARIIEVQGQSVLLDSHVAEICGV